MAGKANSELPPWRVTSSEQRSAARDKKEQSAVGDTQKNVDAIYGSDSDSDSSKDSDPGFRRFWGLCPEKAERRRALRGYNSTCTCVGYAGKVVGRRWRQKRKEPSAVGDKRQKTVDGAKHESDTAVEIELDVFEIESLVKHKMIHGQNHYLVKWQGRMELSWELGEHIPDHLKTIDLKRESLVEAAELRSEESAAGRKKIAMSSPLDLSMLGSLRAISVFAPGSRLWLRLENRWRHAIQNSVEIGELGEDVFCEFDFYDTDADNWQKRHYGFWTRTLKAFITKDARALSKRLLAAVSPRPETAVDDNHNTPTNALLGLVDKYNWQFRRPYPQRSNVELDIWRKVPAKTLRAEQIDFFSDEEHSVDTNELRETSIWLQGDIDWPALWRVSSMIVPAKDRSTPPWLVGNVNPIYYYVRQVLTISFPALCWLLRNHATADDIETAWLHMPIVKPVRQAKVSGTGRKRNAP